MEDWRLTSLTVPIINFGIQITAAQTGWYGWRCLYSLLDWSAGVVSVFGLHWRDILHARRVYE